jgi:hypothetical protein
VWPTSQQKYLGIEQIGCIEVKTTGDDFDSGPDALSTGWL